MTFPAPIDRIQWHEGMLLGPQHFQIESARVDQLVAWQVGLTQPNAWGVSELVLDENLLSNGVIRVLNFSAVMPDGFAVDHSAELSPELDLSLDLKKLGEQADGGVAIYVVLGRSRTLRNKALPPRFVGKQHLPVEDEVSEASPVDIARSRPLLSLQAGELPSSAYVSIKLCVIKKDNELYRRGEYEPPWLSIPQTSGQRQRANAVASQVRSKAVFLAKQMVTPSSAVEDRVLHLEMRARLNALTQGLPLLEAVLQAKQLSPYQLYLALCSQLGFLVGLRPTAVPPILPAWNHAEPGTSLSPLLDILEGFVAEISQAWRTEVFTFNGEVFEIHLDGEWIGERLVVGMSGQTDKELVAWMSGAVIGSSSVWGSLSDHRVLGATRKQVLEVPELGLRGNNGQILFSIIVDPRIVLKDQTFVIGNVNMTRKVPRPQQVVLYLKG